MTLASWYLFLGFPVFVIGLCVLFFPSQFKKEIEPLFESTTNLRLISVWYYTIGAILLYVSYINFSQLSAKLMGLIALVMLGHSGVTQLLPSHYSKFVLKNLKNVSNSMLRFAGVIVIVTGAAMCAYAFV
jgi:uncharacterized protein YjeT (DUF2065 family)